MQKNSSFAEYFIRRPPGVYNYARKLFIRSDEISLVKRKAETEHKLKKIYSAAQKTSYYRPSKYGLDKMDWPYLEKNDVRDAAQALMAMSVLPTSAAQTSGTTGTPLKLHRSWMSIIAEQAAIDLLAAKAGVNLRRARVAILRGDTIKAPDDMAPPFWKYHTGGKRLAISSNHLNSETLPSYIQELEKFQPQLLWVYPTSLEALCGLSEGHVFQLPALKLILSSSEVLKTDLRKKANMTFRVPVYDYYGQAERVSLATSTKPNEYYFSAGYGKTELLFSHGDERQDYYHIIGTSLWNTAQPLIRYKTGDQAILPKNSSAKNVEEICYGIRPFIGISGRESDYLISPDGVHLMGIDHIPRGVDNIVQMQCIQHNLEKIILNIVKKPGYSEETRDQILRQARTKIPQSLAIELRLVDRLERTKNGKAPFVIRKFNQ